ncbi:type I-B CRISPR-associated endonuclease Cas1b [Clostridium algidicarnis]|uniref:CRISPR-associated endonuclease Cas1 n=1 Tax=Clostridium algidicarnis DSM 15099 TaxID=1121295 RepID=A0A2S6FWV2_9CLOT|nr:type I-B CRISPR-associated endonuclease Cas1b [Clostridium algidicarnis]MBB6632277.1 type I-B CRISPR-associated endonuclease Cas1 [Clostridium algidicarnis]MCB2287577.1 type I-B CRISPR-associated endonuclease Cas1b [Clostridium algidicarnis]PPK48076.1 CRISPR-associated Cas1 family protein [Clostridium algidicarnis DSM 15099]
MGKTRYITSIGELTRKDNSICFRNNNKNIYIPVENTREIYCLNEVSINSKLLDFLSKNNIVIHFFNYYGGYSGTFYPKEYLISGKLTVKQAQAYLDDRLLIAKAIVNGIRENIIEVLMHYYKHGKTEIKEILDYLKVNSLNNLENAADIKQILSVEGEVWQKFYSSFQYILKEDFVFNKRVKRPPDNPLNAMISFGNSILYSKTVTSIYHTHLNQSISFLHEPSEGRFSLSLDLCEVFKPIVTFKTIFELVNNRKININKHFEKNLNYCLLNDEGKKIFISALEKRLESVSDHPKLKRKVSVNTLIKLDGYKLIKFIMEGKPFKPYSLKDGM